MVEGACSHGGEVSAMSQMAWGPRHDGADVVQRRGAAGLDAEWQGHGISTVEESQAVALSARGRGWRWHWGNGEGRRLLWYLRAQRLGLHGMDDGMPQCSYTGMHGVHHTDAEGEDGIGCDGGGRSGVQGCA